MHTRSEGCGRLDVRTDIVASALVNGERLTVVSEVTMSLAAGHRVVLRFGVRDDTPVVASIHKLTTSDSI